MNMPRFTGIDGGPDHKKQIVDARHKEDIPCGAYRTFIWDYLNCKTCKGTGIGEEVSGGHKKECETCGGTALDPALLKKFEETCHKDIINGFQIYWSELWVPHDNDCTKCKAFRHEQHFSGCYIPPM